MLLSVITVVKYTGLLSLLAANVQPEYNILMIVYQFNQAACIYQQSVYVRVPLKFSYVSVSAPKVALLTFTALKFQLWPKVKLQHLAHLVQVESASYFCLLAEVLKPLCSFTAATYVAKVLRNCCYLCTTFNYLDSIISAFDLTLENIIIMISKLWV